MSRRALITGISGQDGTYLSQLLIGKGYEVHGTSRDAERTRFTGLERLGLRDRVKLHSMVGTDFRSVIQVLKFVDPDEIYNLAGQSSVGLSFEQPVETLESNMVATLNLLEVIRFFGKDVRLYNACSSECFGNTGESPATISSPFRPRSPYAVAKAAAFWEVANYRDAYDLFACSGILFNHESLLRPSRFVTKKIVDAALRISRGSKEILLLGNLSVRRDWGWAPEYVEAMWLMLQQPSPEDFVIATGIDYSLEQFVSMAFESLGLDWREHVTVDPKLFRPSEILVSSGNPRDAADKLGWTAQCKMPEVVQRMIYESAKGGHEDDA